MRKYFHAAAFSSCIALSGCYEHRPDPALNVPEYSSNYTYIDVVSENGRSKRVLAPEACLNGDAPADHDDGEPPQLLPGCANNFNLQRMVERKRDLVHGRRLSPAPTAPAARAAQNYIDGKREPVLGGGVTPKKETDAASSGTETVPQPAQ